MGKIRKTRELSRAPPITLKASMATRQLPESPRSHSRPIQNVAAGRGMIQKRSVPTMMREKIGYSRIASSTTKPRRTAKRHALRAISTGTITRLTPSSKTVTSSRLRSVRPDIYFAGGTTSTAQLAFRTIPVDTLPSRNCSSRPYPWDPAVIRSAPTLSAN